MAKRSSAIRHRAHNRTRDAILRAAQKVFADNGLSGARVDEIARAAGANKRMIYHYFGNKEGLYLAALERVYENLRGEEQKLHLDHLDPATAIRRLVEFSFDYMEKHPELISLINNENLYRARHLRRSKKVRRLHSPFVRMIDDIVKRGVAEGVFRPGLDSIDLYITMAAVGYFFLANRWTLSAIFGRDLDVEAARRRRRRHNVDMILHAMRV